MSASQRVEVTALGKTPTGTIVTQPFPEPGPDQLTIQVAAAPVNLVDVITIRGDYQFTPNLPYTPGKGPAGTVMAVGDTVENFAPGDRVIAMCEKGGFATHVAVSAQDVYPLPPQTTFEAAAAMSVSFETAYIALTDRAHLHPGETVLVLGANSQVGYAALQLARAMGASQVIAGVRDSSLTQQLLANGATHVISLSDEPVRDLVRDQVFAITDNHGADVVIDPVGGDAFDGAVRCVAWRGRLVVIGFASGRIPTIGVNYTMLKNISISGLQISDYRRRAPEVTRTALTEILRLQAAGEIREPVSTTYPLDRWHDAMAHVAERRTHDRVLIIP